MCQDSGNSFSNLAIKKCCFFGRVSSNSVSYFSFWTHESTRINKGAAAKGVDSVD